jgi:hypothetical protein
MSKFTAAIRAVRTGTLYPDYSQHVRFDAELTAPLTPNAYPVLHEYRIGATLQVIVRVEGENDAALLAAVSHAKQEIVEHLFGEFRADLYKLRRLINDGDREKAIKTLEQLTHAMFDPE